MGASSGRTILAVDDLHTHLHTRWGVARAVDGVSFDLAEGETLGIVGESGCGKTMTALSLMRLLPEPAARIVKGRILLDGEDLVRMGPREMQAIRGEKISMILQDPHTSLDPAFTIGDQIRETLQMARGGRSRNMRGALVNALQRVHVADPARRLDDYPHQMSGGMKQRVVGAIALARAPQVLIADEPTTALDVTIQAQYLALLKELQLANRLSIIFITHDFGVVAHMCDRVAVMYAGRIVEEGPVRDLFNSPLHPYTLAMLGSVPKIEENVDRLYAIEGQPPSLYERPQGCSFAPRCPLRRELGSPERCVTESPALREISLGHRARCHFAEELTAGERRQGLLRTESGRAGDGNAADPEAVQAPGEAVAQAAPGMKLRGRGPSNVGGRTQ